MDVLFVCRRNNGRSQLAEGLYKLIAQSDSAESAGLEVDAPGQRLGDRALLPTSKVGLIIQAMAEVGVDVSDYQRTSITDLRLQDYGKVILLLEPEHIPPELAQLDNAEVWHIDDPQGKGIDEVRATRDAIRDRIEVFVHESN